MYNDNTYIKEGGPVDLNIDERGLGAIIFEAIGKYPDRICQVNSETGETETFGSVKKRSVRVAIELQKRGLTRDDVVVFCSQCHLDNIIPYIATLYLGAKVSSMDPSNTQTEANHLIHLVKPKFIFIENELVHIVEKVHEEFSIDAEVVVYGKSDKYQTLDDFFNATDDEDTFKPIIYDSKDTAFILFSSGSTGLPKGICWSSYSILCFLEFQRLMENTNPLENSDSGHLSLNSLYWAVPLVVNIYVLCNGHRRILIKNKIPENVLSILQEHKTSYVYFVGSFMREILNDDKIHQYDFSHIKRILITGSTLATNEIMQIREIFNKSDITYSYSQTECPRAIVFNKHTDYDLYLKKPESVGKVLYGNMVKVVDIETGQPLGPNKSGEICIKSPTIMNGFYNANCLNEFDEDGFYKTGDVGYYDDDDCFFITDRVKEIFKYKDLPIAPKVIEKVLDQHFDVAESLVIGIPHKTDGNHPTALVCRKYGSNISEEELLNYVNSKVAENEKLRGGLMFVDKIPRTATGKFSRRKAKQLFVDFL